MPIPPNVLAVIESESAMAHTRRMDNIQTTRSVANGVINGSAAKQFDEVSPEASRAIDKILRLPTRGPVVAPAAKPAQVNPALAPNTDPAKN